MVYDDHIRYVTIHITKNFKERVDKCSKYVCDMFEVMIYLTPPYKESDGLVSGQLDHLKQSFQQGDH